MTTEQELAVLLADTASRLEATNDAKAAARERMLATFDDVVESRIPVSAVSESQRTGQPEIVHLTHRRDEASNDEAPTPLGPVTTRHSLWLASAAAAFLLVALAAVGLINTRSNDRSATPEIAVLPIGQVGPVNASTYRAVLDNITVELELSEGTEVVARTEDKITFRSPDALTSGQAGYVTLATANLATNGRSLPGWLYSQGVSVEVLARTLDGQRVDDLVLDVPGYVCEESGDCLQVGTTTLRSELLSVGERVSRVVAIPIPGDTWLVLTATFVGRPSGPTLDLFLDIANTLSVD